MASRAQFPFQLLPLVLSVPGSVPGPAATTPQILAQTQMQPQTQTQVQTQPQQTQMQGGVWSEEEHDRFLEAMQFYPQGPWRDIAEYVGTRSVRQVQTHAQKYHEKIARRLRGLRKDRKKLARQEHRIDEDMMNLCHEYRVEQVQGPGIAPPTTLWGSLDGPNGELLAPWDHHHQNQYQYHQQPQSQQQSLQQQSQQFSDPMFRDYRDYDYIAYIEEEFAFRDAEEYSEERAAAAAAVASASVDLPAFSDCLDYLIDVFGSNQVHRTSSALRMHRHRF